LRATGELPDRAVLRRAEVRDRRPDDSFRGDGISLVQMLSGAERGALGRWSVHGHGRHVRPCKGIAAYAAISYFTAITGVPMTTYSTSDLSRRSGDIVAEALRRPVTIVQRNKPRLVLLSIEDYRSLVARADARTSGTLDDMPDALFEEFRGVVDAFERDGEAR
jgi:prevent-host-death family protein